MGDKSSIEWTDASWNPTTGCDRISPGCDNCYALALAARLKRMGSIRYQNDGDPKTSGPGFALTEQSAALDQPLRWTRPRRIFVNSMSDLFHDDVSDEFIARVFSIMAAARQHQFQLLTKRPQRMARLLGGGDGAGLQRLLENLVVDVGGAALRLYEADWPLPNVWIGTSIENDRYTFRTRHLLDMPAALRFVSLEPLVSSVASLDLAGIDWAIVGGESGPHARPMELAWVDEIAAKAAAAGTALFVKQLGTVWSAANGHGRTHGGDWDLWPERLRVRQFPTPTSPERSVS